MNNSARKVTANAFQQPVSRRSVLGAIVAAGAVGVTTSACSGTSGTSGAAGGGGSSSAQFNFSTWGDYRFYQDGFARMQKVVPKYKTSKFINQQATSPDTLAARLLSSHVAKAYGSMPDVCEIFWSDIPRLADAGLLTDLTDRFAPYKSQVSKATLDAVTYKGRIMACPWRPNTTLVWYRDDVWKEAGVDGTNLKTWADFVAAGKVIRSHKYSDGKSHYIIGTEPNPTFNEYLYTQQGGTLFDPSTHKLTPFATDPRFRAAFAEQVTWSTSGIGLQIASNTPSWYKALDDGILTSIVSGSWTDQQLQQNVPKSAGHWKVIALPTFQPGANGQALQGAAAVAAIQKPGSNQELNWAFMQHSFYDAAITPPLYSQWHLNPCYGPAATKVKYYSDSPYYGGENVGKLDAMVQTKAHSPVGSPGYALLMSLISSELGAAIQGKKSVQAAIDSAYANAQSKNVGV